MNRAKINAESFALAFPSLRFPLRHDFIPLLASEKFAWVPIRQENEYLHLADTFIENRVLDEEHGTGKRSPSNFRIGVGQLHSHAHNVTYFQRTPANQYFGINRWSMCLRIVLNPTDRVTRGALSFYAVQHFHLLAANLTWKNLKWK